MARKRKKGMGKGFSQKTVTVPNGGVGEGGLVSHKHCRTRVFLKDSIMRYLYIGILFSSCSSFIIASELNGEDVLRQLKSFDSVYESAFTATGTCEYLSSRTRIPPYKKEWKIVLNNGQIAYEERVVEIYKMDDSSSVETNRRMGSPRDLGEPMMALKKVVYFGDQMQAKYDFVAAIPAPGVLPEWPKDSSGLATCGSLDFDDPDAPTYNYQVKQALWSMGRGFSKHITNILEVKETDGGQLEVLAEGTGMSYRDGAKWELIIEPSAAYMVRSAKLYERGSETPIISTSNSGVKWEASRCVPENCTWESNYSGKCSVPIRATEISSIADQSFIKQVQMTMKPPYLVYTDVADERMAPPLTMQYRANQLFPKGARKNEDSAINWENLSADSSGNEYKENTTSVVDPNASENEEAIAAMQENSDIIEQEHPKNIKKVLAWIILPLSVLSLIVISYYTFRKKENS